MTHPSTTVQLSDLSIHGCQDPFIFFTFLTVLPDAVFAGELLLALHVGVRAGEHDPGLHRDARPRRLSQRPLLRPLRVHGPDDHEQEPRGLGTRQVSATEIVY